MSSAQSRTLTLIAALARDDHWRQAGAAQTPLALPDRRPTRTDSSAPRCLDWMQLRRDHEDHLAQFVAEHGQELQTTGRDRTSLHRDAVEIAARDDDAAFDLAVLDLADSLRVALAAGDGHEAVRRISCPHCYCWSLLAVRAPGGWNAACRNTRCGTLNSPRMWTLRAIAAHHLRDTRAA